MPDPVTPPVTPQVTPPVTPPTSWHTNLEGIDADTLGYMTAKGWDKLDAPKAALASIKSYRELEKRAGAPGDRLVVWPDKPTDFGPIYDRLGVPKEAKEYDFTPIKFADGTDVDVPFAEAFRVAANSLHLTKDAAQGVVQTVVKYLDTVEAEQKAIDTAKAIEETTKLAADWGANSDAFRVIAQTTAQKLGFTKEMIDAMQGVAGYAATMNAFLQIGRATGEDTFIVSPQNRQTVLTRGEAVAKLNSLKLDKLWFSRYQSGDQATVNEFNALTRIVAGVAQKAA